MQSAVYLDIFKYICLAEISITSALLVMDTGSEASLERLLEVIHCHSDLFIFLEQTFKPK
jgi:hypothetical protein